MTGIKFHEAIRPVVLIMPEMIGYVNTFKVRGGKDKSNKLLPFRESFEKIYRSLY